MIELAGSVTS